MASLSPLQMTSLAPQQMTQLRGPSPDEAAATGNQSNNINVLADQALMGTDVPWGDLYNSTQKDFWNNIIRDPNTGEFANVDVRDYGGGWESFGETTQQKAPSEWKKLSILDYIKDLNNYNQIIPETSMDGTYNFQAGEGKKYQGGLASYFMDNMRNPYMTEGNSPKGMGILDLMDRLGVDTTTKNIGADNRNYMSDYSGISGRYVDQKADEIRNVGNTAGNWFADNPAFNENAAHSDYISLKRGLPRDGSLYGMISPLLGQYAGSVGKSFDPGKSAEYNQWNKYVDDVRAVDRAEDKAFDRQAMAAFASVFAAPVMGYIAPALQGAAPALGTMGSNIAAGALYGAGTSAITGGNPVTGALTGGLGAGLGQAFSGINGMSSADYSQLAAQGLSPAQISQVLGYTGVGPGTSMLYGAGLTNPTAATMGSNLIKSGANSLVSGKKFDPRSAILKSVPGMSGPLGSLAMRAMS